MLWLPCKGGLPLATWKTRINHLSICNLCPLDAQEIPEHTFYECPSEEGVWDKVKWMREIAKLPTRISSWWKAITSIYNQENLGKPLCI